jgi:plasmid stabilization system protein ParE
VIVRWTAGALADLISIENYQRLHWRESRAAFDRRLVAIEQRIAEFPLSAPEVVQRSGVRMVAFLDFPYRLFYGVESDVINVLAIHHTSRQSGIG